jgi:iron complex outermembrane recepter protein
MNRRGPVFLITASAVGLMATADALAQQAGSADQLAEVVVTAEKRATTVETTPISITAVTGADLEQRGIADISGIVQSVPGISMRQSGPGQTELEMRGMTSAGGNSSTVGFYLGDVPLSAPASAQNGKVVIDPNLYDLNRVEVLRGPQGTLYGSGSMGGTIKLVPNEPDTHSFDTSGELILGGTDDGGGFNHGENAMINFPLSDNVAALRLVATQDHTSGWINRVVIAPGDFPTPTPCCAGEPTVRGNVAAAPASAIYRGVNDEDLTSFRATLLLKPTDALTLTPFYMYQRITSEGLGLIDSNPGTFNQYQPFDSPEPFSDRISIGNLNITYHTDPVDFTSATSYWRRDEDLRQDGSEQIATVLAGDFGYFPLYPNGNPTAATPGVGPTTPTSLEDDKSWQLSEEVRLTSAGNGPFKWLLGYFYQDFESDWDLFVPTPDAVPLFGTANGFTQIQPTRIVQNSFFGEASYEFSPGLTGTVGLRRFEYSGAVYSAVSGWLSSSGGPNTLSFVTNEKDQGITPKFDLSYQANKDLLVYGTASKGFRPGGGNQPIPTSGALGTQCEQNLAAIGVNGGAPMGFNPDSVWSYELGEKFRAADGHITLNSAAYFEHWNDIQQNVPLQCGFPFTGNLGSAHIYGGEVELDAVLVPGLMLQVNGGYSHARFVSNPVGSTTTIDNRVQDVPDWTSGASLVFRAPVSATSNFVARVDNDYVGSRIDVTTQPNYLPSYDLTNLRAGFEGGKWSAMLFVNNVANKVAYYSNSPAINVNIPTFNRTSVSQPLTFGIDLSYHFGAK